MSGFQSGMPGMGSRPLGSHKDDPLTDRGKRWFYGIVVALLVLGIAGVAVAR